MSMLDTLFRLTISISDDHLTHSVIHENNISTILKKIFKLRKRWNRKIRKNSEYLIKLLKYFT